MTGSGDNNLLKGFGSRAIHVGQAPCPSTGAVIPPIYMTSTYAQPWPAETVAGYDYTRAGNPNFTNLESQVAALEGAKFALAVSSGLSTLSSLLLGLPAGTRVCALKSAYGGTYRLLTRICGPAGMEVGLEQFGDYDALEVHFKTHKPKYFFFETPTNPLLEVVDIARVAALCKTYNVLSVADNTFMSPYLQNPLALGCDVVIHSCTKYLGGHSDVVGGILLTNNEELYNKCFLNRMAVGMNPSPFDAWMLSRSLKTLHVRMDRHSSNAMKVATFLEGHPMVQKVIYPGLASHPQHEIAKKNLVNPSRGFSGMISVEFKLSMEQTKHFLANCKVFTLAESLGGVESLIEHPASMTHASIPQADRIKIGLGDGLVRMSCGLEEADDLIADIEQALAYAQTK